MKDKLYIVRHWSYPIFGGYEKVQEDIYYSFDAVEAHNIKEEVEDRVHLDDYVEVVEVELNKLKEF